MGNPDRSRHNMRGSYNNPPLHDALAIVLGLGLAADTIVVFVLGGLALRVRTRSAASYDDLARALQQIGCTYTHNRRYMIFVRCAY